MYRIVGNFRGGFIFAFFASLELFAKIKTAKITTTKFAFQIWNGIGECSKTRVRCESLSLDESCGATSSKLAVPTCR